MREISITKQVYEQCREQFTQLVWKQVNDSVSGEVFTLVDEIAYKKIFWHVWSEIYRPIHLNLNPSR